MAIRTWSKFNYGIQITVNNRYLNFKEGVGPELTATLATGDYTIGQFSSVVESALNEAGALIYTVLIDRLDNNKLTISATGTFSLLVNTGSNSGTSPFIVMGYEYPSDLTGASAYTGNEDCGSQYYPQFLLQSYVDRLHYRQANDSTVNKTATGRVEVVNFGVLQFYEMDIKFITDKPMDNVVIKNNQSGVSDAVDFLADISQKFKFEFVPDVDDPETFVKVILETYPGFNDGTGFKLKELTGQNLPDIYETGVMKLRVVP